MLLQWLEDGEVGQDDSPRQVYLMNEGLWQFKYENFTNNLRNLKEVVMKSKGRQVVDAAGFENDRRLPSDNQLAAWLSALA